MRRLGFGPRPEAVRAVAALEDDTRRAVYEAVCRRDEPASRDEVAAATGLSRRSAAFHLDDLAGHGLLAVTFRRLTGRTGPGAGRPSKLYARSDGEVAVSVPARGYDLAGEILAAAVSACLSDDTGDSSRADPERLRAALRATAHETGRQLGAQAAAAGQDLLDLLAQHGFSPTSDESAVVLANCPFHKLAQRHTDIVCGLNLDLARGIIDGLADHSLVPALEPAKGRCCVVLRVPTSR